MARRDALHDSCRNALEKAGWTITHDPYPLPYGRELLFVDLAAETVIAAEMGEKKIAVEIKSLLGTRDMPELERALGQYVLYRSLLKRHDPDRRMYLAVSKVAFDEHFDIAQGRDLIEDEALKVIVFVPEQEIVELWID